MDDRPLEWTPEHIAEIRRQRMWNYGTALVSLLVEARELKPNDRSEQDRRWAIFITDLEKLMAYWQTWVKDQPVEELR